MKIFISMPFANKTKSQILEERAFLERQVKAMFGENTEVAESYIDKAPKGVNSGMWKFAKGIEELSTCDAIVFADGWETAKGCILERAISEHYGLKIIN